ncbi:type I toxin-antitoxin system Fst family toxin [Bombilactobacillus bombi]|uniref:type I toxin-antitoxin system Fst family toxin n=1 Tax=Bombilactobacillus bombi TaxID=1303590 RepID=UPI000E594368|nr:type I toxin-antitoxin system Fst family toxin [Bombilactobacillus bombi]
MISGFLILFINSYQYSAISVFKFFIKILIDALINKYLIIVPIIVQVVLKLFAYWLDEH